MPTLLAIDVSPRFDKSTSRKLSTVFVDRWKAANPGGRVIIRDLVRTNLPFVDLPWIGGAFTPPESHSPESAAAIKVSNDLVAELQAADRILLATPMYNFAVPAILKAYIDHIVRVGVTVSADNKGLLTGKAADIIIASGGDFSPGSPVQKYDQESGYLRQVLAWIGIEDVNVILAGRAIAGPFGETAVEKLGALVEAAALREPATAGAA